MKADLVYAVFLFRQMKTVLLFELADGGTWTLPGGCVNPDESEENALLRHLKILLPESRVTVIEQLGPPYGEPGAPTAKAFICENAQPDVVVNDDVYFQCAYMVKEDLMAHVETEGPPIQCMVWDAFSILDDPIAEWPITSPSGTTGIYCDPLAPHILVEETQEVRREWARLDPDQPDGIMKAPS